MFGKDVVQKILEKYFGMPLSVKIDKLFSCYNSVITSGITSVIMVLISF
jgi:hypothetical protein